MWNFWYVLMMPVAIALICVSVANIDARQKLRSVLALSRFPRRARGGEVCYALALAFAANLAVLVCSTALGAMALMPPVLPRGWPRRPS